MDDSLQEAFGSVPPFSQYDLKDLTTERLGGLTNRNFLVQSPEDDSYFAWRGKEQRITLTERVSRKTRK